ncbi:hypothetical protein JCM5350_005966 [Sporobolomyces pararoseus]
MASTPSITFDWTAQTDSRAMKALVKQRDKVFEWQRSFNNVQFQDKCHKTLEQRVGNLKWFMNDFQPFVRFCRAVEVPVFPVTPRLVALSIFGQKLSRASFTNYVNMLKRAMKETEELVLPLQTGLEGIISQEEAWKALEEFTTERAAMRVSKTLETALVRADEERSACGRRSLGGRSVPPPSTSGEEDKRDRSLEIVVRTPKPSPPKASRKKRARNVSPSPSLSPIMSSDKKPHLETVQTPSKLVSRYTQTLELLDSPATPSLEHRDLPSTTTPQTISAFTTSAAASQASPSSPIKSHEPPTQTQAPAATTSTQTLPLLAIFERDESTLTVPQLTSLLGGLDLSLTVLASPLHRAGFDSIDLLTNLAFLSSTRIDRICRNLERTGGTEVTSTTIALFKQKLEEAKNAGRA